MGVGDDLRKCPHYLHLVQMVVLAPLLLDIAVIWYICTSSQDEMNHWCRDIANLDHAFCNYCVKA